MTDIQHSAEINSSQGTYVAVRETRLPPSAQDPKTSSSDRLEDGGSQILADKAFDDAPSDSAKTCGSEPSFTDTLKQYQAELNHNFDEYEQKLQETNPAQQEIGVFDWDELEYKYQEDVGQVAMKEKEIMSQFDARFKQFMLWMQVSDERESRRAIKRLRTQSVFVQNSEAELAQKELHYSNVMQAFQNAMSLLSRPS